MNKSSLGIKQIIGSVLAAALGVQSSENRKRDFTQGNFYHFVIAGIIGTVLFIAGLTAIVQLAVNA